MMQQGFRAATFRPVAFAASSAPRRGSTTMLGIAATLAVLLASGGVWWWVQYRSSGDESDVLLHTVKRDDFELTVTERGEVESLDVTEVRSLVKSKNTSGTSILRIVPEGTIVEEGDFLVELDSSALVAERLNQQVTVNNAYAAVVEAKNMYETAVIAKREYLEGTFLQERQTIESEIFVAEENLNRAKEYYAYSQKLATKGYVNELQLEADKFAVEKARKELDAAKTKLMVLEEFTKAKMLMQFESDIRIAKARWESAENSHELELGKLEEVKDQIAKCTIVAPQAGVVKYAHETDRRGDQEFIVEEGAIIRERQAIVRLPNADSMQVELTINESLIQYVKPGLPARISPVGLGDRVLKGKVLKVNQYAEPSGWRRANVKEYKAFVSIDEPTSDLRSGMTASVTIRCARVRNSLQVPVQAIYAHGDKMYCFVNHGRSWEAREIDPGPTNDKFFVIESGLEEGEQVALNPRRFVSEVDLPELSPEEAQRAVPQGAPGAAEGETEGETDAVLPQGPPPGGPPGFGRGMPGQAGPPSGFRPGMPGQQGLPSGVRPDAQRQGPPGSDWPGPEPKPSTGPDESGASGGGAALPSQPQSQPQTDAGEGAGG